MSGPGPLLALDHDSVRAGEALQVGEGDTVCTPCQEAPPHPSPIRTGAKFQAPVLLFYQEIPGEWQNLI